MHYTNRNLNQMRKAKDFSMHYTKLCLVLVCSILVFISCDPSVDFTTKPTWKETEDGLCLYPFKIEMKIVKKGEFKFGSPENEWGHHNKDKISPKNVPILEDFYISTTEITQKQYRDVMGFLPKGIARIQDDFPVVNVIFEEAQEFCKKLQEYYPEYLIALPDEVEWEYAARASQNTSIALRELDNKSVAMQKRLLVEKNKEDAKKVYQFYCWFSDNSEKKLHPVGQKQPNPLGFYDMGGNAYEWCSPVEAGKYGLSLDYKMPKCIPMRGGAWNSQFYQCSVHFRALTRPDERSMSVGFRIKMRKKTEGEDKK